MGARISRRAAAGLACAVLTAVVAGCGGGAEPPPRTVVHGHIGHADKAGTHGGHASAPPPAPLRDGERFVNLSIARPYTPKPPSGGTDEYRCFLVDPRLTESVFVTGSQFLPDNAELLHHAILFRVEPGEVAQARNLDENTPGDGWTCFGGPGVGSGAGSGAGSGGGDPVQSRGGAGWIAAWAPGGTETLLAGRIGYRLEAGSQIILQVHYNLLATGGKAAGADRSGVRLRVAPGTAGLRPLRTTLLPAPVELPCAPGESGALCERENSIRDVRGRFGPSAALAVVGLNLLCNGGEQPVPGPTRHCDHQVRDAGTVYAVAGHMHLLGRSIKVELNPGTRGAQTLLDVPVYNFDDQNARPLASPVKIKRGDTLRVTCTHDATLRARLPELRPLPPRYVVWGDGTSDEMCLGIVAWTSAA